MKHFNVLWDNCRMYTVMSSLLLHWLPHSTDYHLFCNSYFHYVSLPAVKHATLCGPGCALVRHSTNQPTNQQTDRSINHSYQFCINVSSQLCSSWLSHCCTTPGWCALLPGCTPPCCSTFFALPWLSSTPRQSAGSLTGRLFRWTMTSTINCSLSWVLEWTLTFQISWKVVLH